MANYFERGVSVLLTVAACVMASAIAARELRSARNTPAPANNGPLVSSYYDDWRTIVRSARVIGDTNARAVIIEFGDYECPFCGEFAERLATMKAKYRNDLALAYVHFPLRNHRFAIPAARGAECAAEQGRFEGYHDALFGKQDSLGLKSWASFAVEAGVEDTSAFAKCLSTFPTSGTLIDKGLQVAEKLNVNGTPTLLVNGWRLQRPPTDSALDAIIAKVIAGDDPSK